MIPKLKAEELVQKFMDVEPVKLSDYTKIYYPSAKQCALILVKEILESDHNTLTLGHTGLAFWQQVKIELEKL